MPTTTNYGWTTPADTDLVKDGASAIRTLGSSIDTTVFANANAGIPKTIVDAKGDLIAGTASDTVARLAVGTNGQVLTADSAEASGVKWATAASGSMTLLSTTTLSGASTTISSISQSYQNLYILSYNVTSNADAKFRIAPNGTTNSSTWFGPVSPSTFSYQTGNYYRLNAGSATANTSSNNFATQIYNYASASYQKPMFTTGSINSVDNGTVFGVLTSGGFNSNTAISSLVFSPDAGSFTGGTVLIYGVN